MRRILSSFKWQEIKAGKYEWQIAIAEAKGFEWDQRGREIEKTKD